jgi:hypothetical protein
MSYVNRSLLVIFLLFIIIGNSGIWYMPNISTQFSVSQSLMIAPGANYIFTNYLEPLIFWIFGGKTLNQYLVYTLIMTIAFFVIFVLWFVKYHKIIIDINYKILSIIIFPVFMVPFYWIGMDGMTLLLMLLAMIYYHSRWGVTFAVLLGTQHFEQGLVSFLLLLGTLTIYKILSKNDISWHDAKKSTYLIMGVILGKLILFAWFNIAGIDVLGTRSSYLENNLSRLVNQWLVSWPYILFSLFGIGWILILKHIKTTYPLVLASIVAFIFIMVVEDQTRVGTIILFPSLFYWVFMNIKILNEITLKYTIVTLAFYLLLPVVYVWVGHPYGSLLKYNLNVFSEAKNTNYNIDIDVPFQRNHKVLLNHKLLFKSIIINGSDLNSAVGQADNEFRITKEGIDNAGHITYGPYIKLTEGSYKFDILYVSSETNTTVVGSWDIGIALPKEIKILKKDNLIGTNNKEGHVIQTFVIPKEYSNEKVEIRNFYNGVGDLTIKSLTITKVQ